MVLGGSFVKTWLGKFPFLSPRLSWIMALKGSRVLLDGEGQVHFFLHPSSSSSDQTP